MRSTFTLKNSLMFLTLLLFSAFAMAQNKKVTGVVTDKNYQPLPAVSIQVVGSAQGTVTDENGKFSISVPANGKLSFNFIGFKTTVVTVSNKTTINIILEEDEKVLGEVVVTALGIKRETKKLGFSVTEVKGEELAKSNQVNPIAALQGKVAGVNINMGAGGPQSSSRINIRGNTSLGGNNQPTIVVDGIIIDNATTGAGEWGGASDFGNEMKNLNPDDFESVSVLKGAAATALYGSRAGNGVIVITTKKGSARKGLGINFSNTSSFETAYKGLDFQNEYGAGSKGKFVKGTDGMDEIDANNSWRSWGPRMNGQEVRETDGSIIKFSPQPNNYLDAYETGKVINSNLSMEGGNENTTFRFSYSNLTSSGITPKNNFDRNNFNLRATHKLSKYISLDAGITYVRSQADNPARQGGNDNIMFKYAYELPRSYQTNYWLQRDHYIDPVKGGVIERDPYAAYYWFELFENNNFQKEDNLRANLGISSNLTNWLTLNLKGNIANLNTNTETQTLGSGAGFSGGYYEKYQTEKKQYQLQGILTANKQLTNDLDFGASLGGEIWNYDDSHIQAYTVGGLKVPGQFTISNSVNDARVFDRIDGKKRMDAVFGFANLAYKKMLFLDLTARNDWSSALTYPDGHGNYSYFYPSASLSWVFTEAFHLPSFFSFGKLRASWAKVGKDTKAYDTSIGNYTFIGNYKDKEGNSIPRYGFDSPGIGNLNLKPEISKSVEVGADVRFFNDRLGLDVAYYKNNTNNQIMTLAVPQESGATSKIINAGNIQNQGIEVLLRGTPVKTNDFTWDATLAFTRNRNKIIELADGVPQYVLEWGMGNDVQTVAEVGSAYGEIKTKYAYARYQQKDANGNAVSHPSNGQKVLKADGYYMRSEAMGQGYLPVGNMQPDFLSSLTNSFNYKNFNLGFMLDARVGGEMVSATYNYGIWNGVLQETVKGRDKETGGLERKTFDASGNVTGTFYDGMIPEGVFAQGIKIKDPKGVEHDVSGMSYEEAYKQGIVQPLTTENYYRNLASWGTGIREHAVFESTWVAMRELSLGYTFPKSITNRLRLNNLRLSLIGRNLFYLYNSAPGNVNPEGLYNNKAGSAFEYGGMPFTRSIGFSINVGL